MDPIGFGERARRASSTALSSTLMRLLLQPAVLKVGACRRHTIVQHSHACAKSSHRAFPFQATTSKARTIDTIPTKPTAPQTQQIHQQVPVTKPVGQQNIRQLCHDDKIEEAVAAFKAHPHPFDASTLISYCARHPSPHYNLDFCFTLYNMLAKPDVHMIAALAQACRAHGQSTRAVPYLWQQIQQHSLTLDKVCFGAIACACATARNVDVAQQLLEAVTTQKYAFAINERDCTQLFQAFCAGKSLLHALTVLNWIDKNKIKLSKISALTMLKSCGELGNLDICDRLHQHLKEGQSKLDARSATVLIGAYGKCGAVDKATCVFQQLTPKDLICWNSIIRVISANNMEQALEYFHSMKEDVLPDAYTFSILLNACTNHQDLNAGKQIHQWFLSCAFPVSATGVVYNNLVTMYAKCGDLGTAANILQQQKHAISADITMWNVLLMELTQQGHAQETMKLFEQMQQQKVKPDKVTFLAVLAACAQAKDLKMGQEVAKLQQESNVTADTQLQTALVKMYAKCGSISEAHSVFSHIKQPDIVAWTAMISALVTCDQYDNALQLYQQMKLAQLNPDAATLSVLLTACAKLAVVETGKQIYGEFLASGSLPSLEAQNALITMFCRAGYMSEAHSVFQQTKQHNDVITWNAMIAGFAQHGQGKQAVELFEQMAAHEISPTSTTFVSLLSGCSHVGLVEEALKYFWSMSNDFGIEPTVTHVNCVVDALARKGLLQEAEEFMQKTNMSDTVTWTTLLGGCRSHKDLERAKHVATIATQHLPKDSASLVLLANIHAASGQWEDSEQLWQTMKKQQLVKLPGQSFVEVNGQIHTFTVGDHSHPQSVQIYSELEKLAEEVKIAGYVPDTKWVLHDMPETDKARSLWYHSEKLAVAFALLSTLPGTVIVITKNLRICGDCHNAMQFISTVRKREIRVRDTNRFHHFKDGKCSCNNYW